MKSAQVWWHLISAAHKKWPGLFRNIRNSCRKTWIFAWIKPKRHGSKLAVLCASVAHCQKL